MWGKETKSDLQSFCYEDKGFIVPRYFVRKYQFSAKSGMLVDPRDRLENLNMTKNGMEMYPYQRVSKQAFEEYVMFLKTKNDARLGLAERVKGI
jgi:hypothetical protein